MSYIIRDDNWIKIAYETFEAQRMRKYYEKLEDTYMNKLKELSAGKDSAGSIYRLIHIEKKGSIDYMAIPEVKDAIKSVNPELFRKPPVISCKLSNDFIYIPEAL